MGNINYGELIINMMFLCLLFQKYIYRIGFMGKEVDQDNLYDSVYVYGGVFVCFYVLNFFIILFLY